MKLNRLQNIGFRFMPKATIAVHTCVCLEMLEGKPAHEAVVSAGTKSVTFVLMGTNSKIERCVPARHTHLLFVNKGRGKAWCLADWVMWQRVSKRHFLLQQRMALGGTH